MLKNDTPAAKAGTGKAGQEQQSGKTRIAESTAGLAVTSIRDGFRRAGYSFGKQPTVIPVSDLSEEQMEAIANEPMLSVRMVRVDPKSSESSESASE